MAKRNPNGAQKVTRGSVDSTTAKRLASEKIARLRWYAANPGKTINDYLAAKRSGKREEGN